MFTHQVSQEKYIFVACVKIQISVLQNCYLHEIFLFFTQATKNIFTPQNFGG
jgi:hypothetical protein